jgi:hypothetical protein
MRGHIGLDETSPDTARFFVAIQTSGNDPQLIECKALNSSYTVDIDFQDGVEDIVNRSVKHLDDLSLANVIPKRLEPPRLLRAEDLCFGHCRKCSRPGIADVAVLVAFDDMLGGMIVDTSDRT